MRKSDGVAGRFFLVGCARSGTTLLQTMLAAHSRVLSFPETHFFLKSRASGTYGRLGLASRSAGKSLLDVAGALDSPESPVAIPRWSPFLRSYVHAFCNVLDQAALDHHKDNWLEKTPGHVRRLDLIEKFVEGAKFVHIVRDGRDVVASLYEVASNYPDVWGQRTVERCIRRWNRDVAISLSKRDDRRHLIVSYEQLITDPAPSLRALCDFLGLEFEPAMINHWKSAEQTVGWMAKYPWMRQAFEPLKDTRLKKFSKLFSPEQQIYIEENLLGNGRILNML